MCYENNEKLYLANSKDLMQLIVDLNLIEFYPSFAIDKQLLKYHHSRLNDQLDMEAVIERD